MRLALLALLVLPATTLAQQPPPLVAPTDALSPAEEKKGFTVPAGFEVQLVASEPAIQKPMQMAFDAKGRLWVTTSYHYPFAAPQGKGTDKLFLLSNIDPATGKAGKVQVFADDLNIPIGVLPLPDCKSVIVSSTGEIRKYTDTNDDGKADKMEVLFSGFGYVDTHGMYNSFTLMPDGWVYACHGFRNDSRVKGKDGHEVVMNSGNTFRFRPDGSRIEVYTRGQVNPFGIAVDPWFNLYTADCHSKPITQLIPGAYYESFGKPHDGLGFAAHVTRHDHGSTGLCGLAWYDADQFPKDYLGCMFVGNVVTSRINFDKIEWHGATPVAKELPDFLTSKDLWFRPVDIKLGPDGVLYISDFYNKIIGHYEVDLKHPGRDRDRGRLWRVVWKGKGAKEAKMPFADLTKLSAGELVNVLAGSDNLSAQLLVTNELIARVRKDRSVLTAFGSQAEKQRVLSSRRLRAAYAWADLTANPDVRRIQRLSQALERLTESPDAHLFAVHVLRAVGASSEFSQQSKEVRDLVVRWLAKQERSLLRTAVEAVIFHPHADFIAPLVELLKKCPPDDTHLKYAARVALRNCLKDNAAWPRRGAVDPIYSDIALAIPDVWAAAFLMERVAAIEIADANLPAVSEHIARNGTGIELKSLIKWLTNPRAKGMPADAILASFRGVQARGSRLTSEQVDLIMAATHREIDSLREIDAPKEGEVRRVQAALRVLSAFTAVVDRRLPPSATALSQTSCERLDRIIAGQKLPAELRAAAADVLLRYSPETALQAIRAQLANAATDTEFRAKVLLVFASSANRDARLDARDALKDAPYRTAVAVGTALAGTPAGAEDLLDAVKQGKAPARLLQEKAILERLRAAKLPNLDRQIGALTKGLPPLDQKIAELMKKRSVAYTSAKPDKELGLKIFTKHCGACHKIGEAGGKIAPQLDGVGNRGLERLLEDTLDPNRNVDQAFRARIITTKDERTITGLMLRVEGEVVVVADAEGKEVRVPTKEIDSNRETMLSPMPANFGDAIPEADFNHLLAYLLEQRAKDKK